MSACPTCSQMAPDGSRFCPFCGGKLAELVRKPQDPLIGKTVDNKYLIKERIGTGAMGSIYKAEHRALSKQIALKVLHRHLLLEESHVKRFHREAKAASRLNHPNAIAMLDFGQTEDGLSYIAMEFLPGRDLCRILFEEGHLSVERTVRISAQILDALTRIKGDTGQNLHLVNQLATASDALRSQGERLAHKVDQFKLG